MFVLVAFLAFALSIVLTEALRRVLMKRQMLDIPNDRSMHKAPIPRGGGLAVMAVVMGGLAVRMALGDSLPLAGRVGEGGAPLALLPDFLRPAEPPPPREGEGNILLLLLPTILLITLSWLDDRKGLSARLRLAVHLLAAWLGSLAFTPEQTLFAGHMPFALDRAVMIVGWAWFMNLYNFMDGIDGITGAQTITTVAGVALISALLPLSDPGIPLLAALLIGACGGFLTRNWHPAKIFLGDVGSVPLGFLTGYLLLLLAVHGAWAAALILPLYYLADSGITLGRRLLRGEKFWKPHREHFYQRAAQGVVRHDRVVMIMLIANLGLMGLATLSISDPLPALVLAIGITALLLFTMRKLAPPKHTPPPPL